MKSLSTLAAITVLAFAACEPKDSGDGTQAARDALPTSDTLSITVPGGTGKAAEKVGDVASTYLLTRAVAGTLNGSAAAILILARTITEYPVTSIEGDTYVWGPWSDALKPGQYRMTVRQTSEGDFVWAIEGRDKGSSDAFAAIVSGTAHPGQPHRGSGSFTFDCDLSHAIDPYGGCDDGGQISVTYDLEHAPATITVDDEKLAPMPDGTQGLQTFHYAYAQASDGGGSLTFSTYGDTDDLGAKWENTTYTSRWKASGAGRTDASVTGGDIGSITVSAIECWSTSYLRTYYTDSAGWLPTEGSAAACVF